MTAAIFANRTTVARALLAILFALAIVPFFLSTPALATNTNAPAAPPAPPPRTALVNPLGRGVTFQTLIGRLTRMIMGVAGSFALLMFVWGGFMWVTSAGNMDKVKKGKQIFTWSVIGLIVIYGSYVILELIFRSLAGT